MADEFGGKTNAKKQQQPKVMLPLNKHIFQEIPEDFRKSFVDIGDASPIAEESPRLNRLNSSKSDRKDFQSSPNIIKRKTYFTGTNKMPKHSVAQSGQVHKKNTSFGDIIHGVKVLANKLVGRLPEEDLLWFARLMEVRTIQSDFFFEKYMVVGLSDDSLSEA